MTTDKSELPADIFDQSVIFLAKGGSSPSVFSTCMGLRPSL